MVRSYAETKSHTTAAASRHAGYETASTHALEACVRGAWRSAARRLGGGHGAVSQPRAAAPGSRLGAGDLRPWRSGAGRGVGVSGPGWHAPGTLPGYRSDHAYPV